MNLASASSSMLAKKCLLSISVMASGHRSALAIVVRFDLRACGGGHKQRAVRSQKALGTRSHTDWPRSWHLRALTGDTTRLRVRWSHGSGWFLIASDTIRARLGRSLRIFGIAAVRLALLRSLCRGGQASVALALAGQTHPCPFVALALPEYSAFLRVDGLRVPAQSPELRVWPGK